MRPRLPILCLSLLLLLAAACSSGQKLPESKPLPADTTFGGVWFSPQYEHMFLRQTGDEVRGIYTYATGGTLEGTVDGNLLTFEWIDPGNKDEARRPMKGKGYLQLVKDGEKVRLVGEWGYDQSAFGGGPWEATYVRPMDAEDPRSLEQWQEQN